MKDSISNGNIFIADDERTGITLPVLKRAILENLFYVVGKWPDAATDKDHFMALAYTVRDRILARWLTTKEDYIKFDVRSVYYLSAEFLMGPHLANNMLNLGLQDQIREAIHELDQDLDVLIQQCSLLVGNGGLPRIELALDAFDVGFRMLEVCPVIALGYSRQIVGELLRPMSDFDRARQRERGARCAERLGSAVGCPTRCGECPRGPGDVRYESPDRQAARDPLRAAESDALYSRARLRVEHAGQ